MSNTAGKAGEPRKVFGITIGGAKANAKTGTITKEEKEAFQYLPTIPVVNVVPNSVFEKYQVKGVLRKLFLIALVIAVVIGGIWAGGQWLIGQQNSQSATLQGQASDLQNQTGVLQPYLDFQNAVDAKRTTLYGATQNDINLGAIYAAFLLATAEYSVDLPQLSFGVSVAGQGSGCVAEPYQVSDPNAPAEPGLIGCISLQGSSDSYATVNGFLNYLLGYSDCPTNDPAKKSTPGAGGCFADMFLKSYTNGTDATTGEPTASFEASIGFTQNFYTHRFANLSVPLDQVLSGTCDTTTDATAAPTATPSPTDIPTPSPTDCSTSVPSDGSVPPAVPNPTTQPTDAPTDNPTPTSTPTDTPSNVPTADPTSTGGN